MKWVSPYLHPLLSEFVKSLYPKAERALSSKFVKRLKYQKVLNTHCYQINTPIAIIRYDGGAEDVVVGHETGDNCLTAHEKCFDESAEHKTIYCLIFSWNV